LWILSRWFWKAIWISFARGEEIIRCWKFSSSIDNCFSAFSTNYSAICSKVVLINSHVNFGCWHNLDVYQKKVFLRCSLGMIMGFTLKSKGKIALRVRWYSIVCHLSCGFGGVVWHKVKIRCLRSYLYGVSSHFPKLQNAAQNS
jgi:hypothetical protein